MPEWLHSLRLRLRALIRRSRLEQDLQDEMAFHLAMREEKERQAGTPADQARIRARRQFGNVGVLKNRTQMCGSGHGSRTLAKTRGSPCACCTGLAVLLFSA